jgi:regulatory subunit for Cdc7p protein kinase
MAAVSISPLPHTRSTMSGRRVPLSSNPNAVNSPYRAVAAGASKQKRSYATVQREEAYGQQPPAKKQMFESHQPLRTPPRQQSTQSSAEGRVFTRKSNAPQQSAFERKCVAVREKPQQIVTKAEKPSGENLDTIRQWQKHYRKIFPTFVFYFESVPEEVRLKYTKQVIALGAVSFDARHSSRMEAILILRIEGRKILLKCSHSCCYHSIDPSRTEY